MNNLATSYPSSSQPTVPNGTNSTANSTVSTISTPPLTFEAAIYPPDSFLSLYMDAARRVEESADSYLIGGIMPVCGAALGRQVYFCWGGKKIYPNLFAMLVGKPGDRKSSSIKHSESLAKSTDLARRLLPHSCSPESLADQYDVSKGGCPDLLLIADDANAILGTWKKANYGERVAQQMLELYDCGGFSEAFRRNNGETEGEILNGGRRYIEETSTSLVFGATPNIAQLQGHSIRSGLERRFLYYIAERHGRFHAMPPEADTAATKRLSKMLQRMLAIEGRCTLCAAAEELWCSYQRRNRELLHAESDEATAARLNGAPTHVLKIGMIFAVAQWVFNEDAGTRPEKLEIDPETLRLAIDHVDLCLRSAAHLDQLANRTQIQNDAGTLLAKVNKDFGGDEQQGWIRVTRTDLTAKYCHHSARPGCLKPDDLYRRLIPELVRQGKAQLMSLDGRRECYGFKLEK